MWQHWVNAVLGLVVLATPFLALSAATLTWTLAISGIIIAALGLWGALGTTAERTSLRYQH
jgi:hypothetical protein